MLASDFTFNAFENMIPRNTFLSSSLVPSLLWAAGLGTRRIEVILRIAAVSLCVEFVCRALAANDYQYYLPNWRTKKSEVRQRQRRVCFEEVRVCYMWYWATSASTVAHFRV